MSIDIAREALHDAMQHVERQSDDAIITPKYTESALEQNGWQLSYGQGKAYRTAFTAAYVLAWTARYVALTAGVKPRTVTQAQHDDHAEHRGHGVPFDANCAVCALTEKA